MWFAESCSDYCHSVFDRQEDIYCKKYTTKPWLFCERLLFRTMPRFTVLFNSLTTRRHSVLKFTTKPWFVRLSTPWRRPDFVSLNTPLDHPLIDLCWPPNPVLSTRSIWSDPAMVFLSLILLRLDRVTNYIIRIGEKYTRPSFLVGRMSESLNFRTPTKWYLAN